MRKTLDGVAGERGFAAKLTERKGLTPAQIRTAVRFARLASGRTMTRRSMRMQAAWRRPAMLMETLIERQLDNADKALGNKAENDARRRSVTTYDLDC